MQQGILLDYLSTEHPGSYVQQLLGTIYEPLDPDRFRRAWQHLAERHPTLRTSFHMDGEEPVQKVVEPVTALVDFVDWRKSSGEALERAMNSFLDADRQRGFEIDTPPLFRVTAFHLSHERYQFVWTSHHLLMDGRSRYRLLRELYLLYEEPGSLDAGTGPAPYRSFEERRLDLSFDSAERFWRSAWPLDVDDQSVVEVLSDCSSRREAGHGFLRRTLKRSLAEGIRALADQAKVAESTVFHAAWTLFSHRYTGAAWQVFGVTRSCRSRDTDDFVGLCVNTVPLAVSIETGDSVESLLKRARSRWRALDGHDQAAVSDIAKWRRVHRGLFDVIVNFESYELNERLRGEGDEWRGREFSLYGTTNLPLVVSIYSAEQYKLELVHHRSLLDDSMAESICDQYIRILEQLTDSVSRPVSDIKLVSEQAFKRHVDAASIEGRIDESVTDRFREVVVSGPDAVALSCGRRGMTYAELESKANGVAAALAAEGIQPGMRVGVLLDRSFEMVASWLAILKAGAVYVPLDPGFPLKRIQFIIGDAGIPLLVTHDRHAETARRLDANTLFVDSLPAGHCPVREPERAPGAGDPAYVMYTSGSTGDPKGVVVPHRGIVRLVCGNDYIPFGPERVFLMHSSVVFDASTFELWGALLNGARCVILEGDGADPGVLGDTLRSHEVDCLWLTSSLFNLLVEERAEILRGVKYLLVGGEALSVHHVVQGLDLLSGTRIINGYGPTENTTFSCTFAIPRDFDRNRRRVPIGKPIRHTYVYILDHAGMPVPAGFPGELVIGGAGLAAGYLNRHELTANAFVADPFSSRENERVYRSGDRCRRLEDGQIEFIGRLDEQHKVRGFRVELGEINAVLNQHRAVTAAATLVVETGGRDGKLESWVVTRPREAVTGEELRNHAAERLPYFSVPWRINIIDELPLTTSGKIDRSRLMADRRPGNLRPSGAPQDALTRELAGIWNETLGTNDTSPDSDFFDSGGDSLSATRLLLRVENRFGVRIPLSRFLMEPTVEFIVEQLFRPGTDAPEKPGGANPPREEFVL